MFQTSTALFKISGLKNLKKKWSKPFLQQMFKQFFQINFYVLAKNMYGVGGGWIAINSYLTTCVCSLNHYDLKV